MAKRILITGGAGFIGSHIADRFLRAGWSVRVLDCLQPRVHREGMPKHLPPDVEAMHGDVRNRADWERALEGVAVVSHQAAYQDYVPDRYTGPRHSKLAMKLQPPARWEAFWRR